MSELWKISSPPLVLLLWMAPSCFGFYIACLAWVMTNISPKVTAEDVNYLLKV